MLSHQCHNVCVRVLKSSEVFGHQRCVCGVATVFVDVVDFLIEVNNCFIDGDIMHVFICQWRLQCPHPFLHCVLHCQSCCHHIVVYVHNNLYIYIYIYIT